MDCQEKQGDVGSKTTCELVAVFFLRRGPRSKGIGAGLFSALNSSNVLLHRYEEFFWRYLLEKDGHPFQTQKRWDYLFAVYISLAYI